MMIDPRLTVINKRLKDVRNVIAVGSGKGGVGKSLIATSLALVMARKGYSVGLMDLDFNCPSCHIILGIDLQNIYPEEEKGVTPPQIYGTEFMSIAYYTKDEPMPLRGSGISNAIIELFAITRWSKLDFLFIDLPPGTSDELLDILRLIEKQKVIAITTPHILSIKAVEKFMKIVNSMNREIIGIIENMSLSKTPMSVKLAKDFNTRILGVIPYIPTIENYIGSPVKLLSSDFAKYLAETANRILDVLADQYV